MYVGPDLCWLTVVLASAVWVYRPQHLRLSRCGFSLGVLLCFAVVLFPIISWDDDVLRSRDPDTSVIKTLLDSTREEKRVSGAIDMLPTVLPMLLAGWGAHAAAERLPPTLPVPVSVMTFPPLGRRPPPVIP